MAQQNINIGAADAKAGDTLFSAFTKTQENFTELFAVGLNSTVDCDQSNIATTLGALIDSTKVYLIDGVIDFTGTGLNIEVPAGGINIIGSTFNVSELKCTDAGYTLFTSPVGGSGDVLRERLAVEVSGVGSQVYNLIDSTGFHAIESDRVNYNNCTSLGNISNYRQGLETGTGRFGGTPELTLTGPWVGGYFIDVSIVRSLTDGAYSLYKAGAGFTMASRFRSNQNIDLPSLVSFLDFAPANFTNPSTLQLEQCIITRNGISDASDTNLTPNVSAGDLVSSWTGNNGLPNTFEGGSIGVTTETATTITVDGQFEDLDATLWTTSGLQHFNNPAGNQLRHLGNSPREYKVVASFALDSTANNVVSLRVSKFDSSTTSTSTVLTQTRQVNNFVGGRDVAFFNINVNTTLDNNDYIFLEVANVGATNNITAEVDSYYVIEER
ncbi:MAG: hypothetical protein HRU18_00935 [Pseudoalteromonas sp.]|uniref:hypothetical protein n=1 Tax=Pseudoalteromonas sp. TaxID=53249 RepID=UPI001DC0D3BB|nr:hypothetical protein [Pseudoalteromonas sp.]NRA76745.1 hypothetical protein [Pseudoalteromonas sp.]